MGITQNIGASSLIKPGVIDNTAARPASPYEGQVIFQKDTDQLLVWNGTAWVIPNSPAQNPTGLELIKSQTIGTAVSTVTVSDAFSSLYDNYLVKITGVNFDYAPSAQDGRLYLGSTTSGYKTSLNYGGWTSANYAGVGITGATWYWVGVGGPNTTTNISFELSQPYATQPTYMINTPYIHSNSAGATLGIEPSSTSHTSFTYYSATGTITGGTIQVYGFRK
jgi:hypothetical protein